jgi:hypothetical protein
MCKATRSKTPQTFCQTCRGHRGYCKSVWWI